MLLTDREPGEQRRRSQKSQISQRDFHFQFLMIYGFATYVVQIQTRRKIKPSYVELVIGKLLLLCIGVWPQTKQKCYLWKDLPDKNISLIRDPVKISNCLNCFLLNPTLIMPPEAQKVTDRMVCDAMCHYVYPFP